MDPDLAASTVCGRKHLGALVVHLWRFRGFFSSMWRRQLGSPPFAHYDPRRASTSYLASPRSICDTNSKFAYIGAFAVPGNGSASVGPRLLESGSSAIPILTSGDREQCLTTDTRDILVSRIFSATRHFSRLSRTFCAIWTARAFSFMHALWGQSLTRLQSYGGSGLDRL